MVCILPSVWTSEKNIYQLIQIASGLLNKNENYFNFPEPDA